MKAWCGTLIAATSAIALAPSATATIRQSPAAVLPPGAGCHSAPFASTPCPGVRPGAVVVIGAPPVLEGTLPDGYCTLGFVFRAGDARYISTAGHCAGVGDGEEQQWATGTGAAVYDRERRRIGEFAYAVKTATSDPQSLDFALIRLDAGIEADPEVCHFGGPAGIDDRVIPRGRLVPLHFYGNTFAGGYVPGAGEWLLPARTGTSDGMPNPNRVYFNGHASFADSGAPIVSADGRAVALISGPGRSDPDGYAGLVYAPRLGPQIRRAEAALGTPLQLENG